jgi:hypothetical protein
MEPRLRGREPKAAFEVIDRELDNLRAAILWAEDHDPVQGLRLASSVPQYWEEHAGPAEGRRWCESLLRKADNAPARYRGKALRLIAVMAFRMGDFEIALDPARRAVELLRDGDATILLHALVTLRSHIVCIWRCERWLLESVMST